ncbi:hypothetical protein FOZ60_008719 [Perkinsus olseni]|uniref:RRM domain-containing protein n=1 Tax=Perkinsus olseni TaxID=32597 RepID=A0A7J6PE84_PEROL|nr:hypothetical protein FOZ60_008719 [Perkinsus olseni]
MVRQRSSAPRSHGWDYLSEDHENRGDRPGSATRTLMFVRLPREVSEADLVQLVTKYSPKSCCEDGCVESTKVVRDSWGRSRCFAFVRFAHTSCALHVKRHADRQQMVAYDRFGTGWTVGATWAKNPNKAGEKETKKKASKSQKKKDKKRASPSLVIPSSAPVQPSEEASQMNDIAQRLRDEAIRSLTARQHGTQASAHLTEVVNSMLGMPVSPLYPADFINPASRIWSLTNQATVGSDNSAVQPIGPLLVPRSVPSYISVDDLQRSPPGSAWPTGVQQQLYSDTPSTSPVFTPVPADQQASSVTAHHLGGYAPSYSGILAHPFGLCNPLSIDNTPPSAAS